MLPSNPIAHSCLRVRMTLLLTLALTLTLFFVLPAPAASPKFPKFKKSKPAAITATQDEYLRQARAMNLPTPTTIGSLWVNSGPYSSFATDYHARNAGDLIVIHITDNFTAATNGDTTQQRQFATNSALTGFLGTIGAKNRLSNIFAGNSNTSLSGKGQSTLSSNVSLNLAAQVLEVLPNGVLVVQAARDILVGNDRQTVLLRGLVRPGDLAPDNSITSSLISNLQVEIKGKGAVADTTRQPNVVIRTLLKLFTF